MRTLPVISFCLVFLTDNFTHIINDNTLCAFVWVPERIILILRQQECESVISDSLSSFRMKLLRNEAMKCILRPFMSVHQHFITHWGGYLVLLTAMTPSLFALLALLVLQMRHSWPNAISPDLGIRGLFRLANSERRNLIYWVLSWFFWVGLAH